MHIFFNKFTTLDNIIFKRLKLRKITFTFGVDAKFKRIFCITMQIVVSCQCHVLMSKFTNKSNLKIIEHFCKKKVSILIPNNC